MKTLNRLVKMLSKPFERAINRAASMVQTIKMLGEISRDVKELRKDMEEIKGYLARQEEIAKVMIEQGIVVEDEDFFTPSDDDIDKKDMN